MDGSTTGSILTYKHSLSTGITDGSVVIDVDDSNVGIGLIIGGSTSWNYEEIHKPVDGVGFIFPIEVEDTVDGGNIVIYRGFLTEGDPLQGGVNLDGYR